MGIVENKTQEPQKIDRLDLEKYGLSYLKDRNVLDLTSSDMEKLLNALGNDDISLNVPLPFISRNIRELLSQSECRRCGKCCLPNSMNPGSPGVEVFEDELESIARHLDLPYETLKEKTRSGQNSDAYWPLSDIISTRLLPLPCPFYVEKTNVCQVYQVRPRVCVIYPIVSAGDDNSFSIKINCEYGKEIAISALRLLKRNNPGLVLKI